MLSPKDEIVSFLRNKFTKEFRDDFTNTTDEFRSLSGDAIIDHYRPAIARAMDATMPRIPFMVAVMLILKRLRTD